MWDIINKISSICGIIGFLISICSIFFNIFIIKILNINCIKNNYKEQKNEYNKNSNIHYEKLQSLFDSIYEDKIISPKVCDSLIQELLSIRLNFSLILSFSYHYKIRHCIKQLQKDELNVNNKMIRNDLNYIVARLQKRSNYEHWNYY